MTTRGERVGTCDDCGFELHVTRFRGQWLCRQCMYADEIPCDIADHMSGSCALADHGRMDGAAPSGTLSWSTPFSRALDAAMKKRGWGMTQGEYKNSLFAGANDGNAARIKRWATEFEREG